MVQCGVTPDAPTPICALSQEQASTETQQRVLAIEIQPLDAGIAGTLVLPFGLDLSAGVTLAIDDAAPLPKLPFRTCVPGGCLVSLDFAADLVTALRSAESLRIATVADGGAPAPFSISLNGFAGALDRTIALVNPAQ
jgi:invasion protein IalB